MAGILTKAWNNLRTVFSFKSKTPMYNEPTSGISVVSHAFRRRSDEIDHKILWRLFKRSPEVVALISAIVEDIMSDGWTLVGGRNQKKTVEEFFERNNAKEIITSFLFDAFVTGDAYLYKSKISNQQIRQVVKNIVARSGFEMKAQAEQVLTQELEADEDIMASKQIITIPASTMYANYDPITAKVKNYTQRVENKSIDFSIEEIIHFRLMRLDGKFYGWTPLISIVTEMQILSDVKDLANYFFSKGGVPNFMFILPNDTPDSPNYKRLEKSLGEYAKLEQKYKSLLVTGKDIEIKELNRINRDMEFRELARYMTQVMVMTWGVPASRLSELLIAGGVRGSTVSAEGYYRKISHFQDIIEDLLNTQLLKEFGDVKLRFKRTYKQDELRETQNYQVKSDVALKLFNSDFVKKEWVWQYLEIPEEMQGNPSEESKKPIFGNRQGYFNQGQMLSESPEKLAQDKDKQSIALQKK